MNYDEAQSFYISEGESRLELANEPRAQDEDRYPRQILRSRALRISTGLKRYVDSRALLVNDGDMTEEHSIREDSLEILCFASVLAMQSDGYFKQRSLLSQPSCFACNAQPRILSHGMLPRVLLVEATA